MNTLRSLPAPALALALAAALPTTASAQATQAELYIDVATHTMPGMPGMGALGRMAGAMGAGAAPGYGMARHPGMPGKYLDVALHNQRRPGTPARQAVPKGLRLGERIDLLPPASKSGNDATPAANDALGQHGDGSFRIRYYWGCGEQVRAGQPAEFTVTVRNGKVVQSGRAMTPRQVPQHAVGQDPRYALWPNPSARKTVAGNASLAGTHTVTGEQLPASLQFELGRDHDFMPELKLKSEGDAGQGMTLRWDGVDGARAYFIHGTAMDGETIVMWSSSEDGYAGQELIDFLPESLVAQWTGKRTLMGADARSCRIPREVFAGTGKGTPMLQMVAYGNDRTIAQPGWSVRVRTKSTAMLMSGLGGAATQEAGREAAKPAAKDAAKSVLRGLIGR
ncbi:hypothetical protein [Pseudoxanthomonas broegbernensis]|uniref:hypothetical protein n=1 Tax=Pseudoxanthomonas broegbernensis TaxID=83619 RepID=UPI0013919712|nr:hypothetical protein [Pseudoxanthomonas broegbernensis]MBB6065787.1 hypothetical protein [Pseudoxanthomonas broegbernensis]